jgi:hypothetical protein
MACTWLVQAAAIQAKLPEGARDDVLRTATENASFESPASRGNDLVLRCGHSRSASLASTGGGTL